MDGGLEGGGGMGGGGVGGAGGGDGGGTDGGGDTEHSVQLEQPFQLQSISHGSVLIAQ